MWRNLIFIAFLSLLANFAKADVITQFDQPLQISSTGQNESQVAEGFEVNVDVDSDSPPPIFQRTLLSLFASAIQLSPNYVLETEFFESKLDASLYKNLANPPNAIHWFETLSYASASRVSGWKDGNNLYKSRITYHG